MKIIVCVSFFLVALALSAIAEPSHPDYESLPPEVQQSWGLRVQRYPGGITVFVPAKSGKVCQGASLCLYDAQGHQLMESDLTLDLTNEGGRALRVRLAEGFQGSAVLIINTAGSPMAPNTAEPSGLTFRLVHTP